VGINNYPFRNFNPRATFVDSDRTLAQDGLYLVLALFNRLGGGSGGANVRVGVVAAGNSQASAFLLTGDWNYVENVAPATGVAIPPIPVGADCIVFNAGANSLSVYPSLVPAGQGGPVQIDALGANVAYGLAAGKMQWFRMVKPSLLKSTQFG
jgi:hypothetical protein